MKIKPITIILILIAIVIIFFIVTFGMFIASTGMDLDFIDEESEVESEELDDTKIIGERNSYFIQYRKTRNRILDKGR